MRLETRRLSICGTSSPERQKGDVRRRPRAENRQNWAIEHLAMLCLQTQGPRVHIFNYSFIYQEQTKFKYLPKERGRLPPGSRKDPNGE